MFMYSNAIYTQRNAMPMAMGIGEPKSGKSTSLNCAASLTGIGIFATGTGIYNHHNANNFKHFKAIITYIKYY